MHCDVSLHHVSPNFFCFVLFHFQFTVWAISNSILHQIKAPEMLSFAYTQTLLISSWTILHRSISRDGCLSSLLISLLTYKILTYNKWHVHEKGHITVSSRKLFPPPSISMASKDLKLTAIQWTKTWWPQLMTTALRQVLCCLPSHWTVWVKSGASCHIK